MPNLAYQYRTLNDINWPAPDAAVPQGQTSCWTGAESALHELHNPLVPTVAALANAALAGGVYPPEWLEEEANWRLWSLQVTLQVDPAGYLVPTPIYAMIDAQETSALSFLIGQTFTAVIAGTIAAAPGLFLHWDRWCTLPAGAPTYASARRPDFISFLGPRIQIWEAKTRQTGGMPVHLRNAFNQTLSVLTVDGVHPPNAHVACVSRVLPAGNWQTFVTDPETSDDLPLDSWKIFELLLEYYRPWRQWIRGNRAQAKSVQYGGQMFTVVPRPGSGTSVGMDQRLITLFNSLEEGKLKTDRFVEQVQAVLDGGYTNSLQQQ